MNIRNKVAGIGAAGALLASGCSGVEHEPRSPEQEIIHENEIREWEQEDGAAAEQQKMDAAAEVVDFLESISGSFNFQSLIQPEDGFEMEYTHVEEAIPYDDYLNFLNKATLADCEIRNSLIVFQIEPEDGSDNESDAIAVASIMSPKSLHLTYGNVQAAMDVALRYDTTGDTPEGYQRLDDLERPKVYDLTSMGSLLSYDNFDGVTTSGCIVWGRIYSRQALLGHIQGYDPEEYRRDDEQDDDSILAAGAGSTY